MASLTRQPAGAGAILARADRLCDAGVLAFALFTLGAHVAVFAGLGLDSLVALAGTLLIAAPFVPALARRAGAGGDRAASEPEPVPDAADAPGVSDDATSPPVWLRASVAAAAAACAIAYMLRAPLALVWVLAFAAVGTASLRELLVRAPSTGSAARAETAARASVPSGTLWLLGALSLVCVALTLASHRPDADDAFYLNLAVAAVDHPEAPLLANDTLHGVPDVPLVLPVYRVHSFELFEAVLSRVTGRPVLDVAHLWLPALAALFVPLAFARSLRIAMPRSWPWALCIAIGTLLFTASASHGAASFGLVRLHQGKALLRTLILPLTIAYALELGRDGGRRAWLRLAAAQIAAVGLSASGLWLAPAVALPALLAGVPDWNGASARRRLLLGALASAYPLALALALRAATTAAFRDAPVPGPEAALASVDLARQALHSVLGTGVPGALALFVALAAWSFARTRSARRLCAFAGLAAFSLWNPFSAAWIAASLTSAPTYWRVLWLIPLPLLAAIALAAAIEHGPRDGRPRIWRIGATALLASLLAGASAWLVPRSLAVSSANHVRLGAPGWKIPPAELDAARAIAGAAGPDALVLAPRHVAPWLVTLHRHPSPLVVRAEYLPVLHEKLGEGELQRRMRLMRLVSGQRRPARAEELLREALRDDRLRVVCLAAAARRWQDVTGTLAAGGFQKIYENTDYEVWRRL